MAYLREHEIHVAEDRHWSASVFYMENLLGAVQVEACTKCDHVEVQCEHKKNTWNADGTVLTCMLCGADVT